ncbi:MAG: AAA family ATPase [Bacteroidota bacterium]|nr:AAA family ATPase [Bacteroidota bacterium]|tara:strand:+ start:97 stop:1104 length:1008 start_codon:yes stop_codon:yes gene_type:complete
MTKNEITIDTSALMPKQLKLWRLIRNRAGVVMLRGKAGVAKSATCNAIAKGVLYNGQPLNFIDLRLSQMDETHFGFPYRQKAKDGSNYEVMDYAMPEWFEEACDKPTLINFEELNRCSQDVQNAALEILNERTLHGKKLPEHVYMIATGNMGEEDGCAVQEFDNALINRLILVDFELTYEEWCEYYANENVTNYVVDFIADYKEQHYYTPKAKILENEGLPFATPRSWTNLSKVLMPMAESNNFSSIINFVKKYGKSYVGKDASIDFQNWLGQVHNITFDKVIAGKVREYYFTKSDLVRQLKAIKSDVKKGVLKTDKLNKREQENLKSTFEKFGV